MLELAEILHSENIHIDIPIKDVSELFQMASSDFSIHSHLDKSLIENCLLAREALGSTGLGVGVAIPHGRVKGLKNSLASFYRLSNGVDFHAEDGIPVNLVLFLLVPEQANQKHLDLLSEIAQILSDKSRRTALQEATTVSALLEIFTSSLAH
ncbi:MAG: PTS sugar transporter subunit IIA [Betaproteobacteria bacterium]|jgi:PTS system nitrogen regulatory IIA component